ncbi:MAG: SagB/ThcOx family dehydrogenase [Paludibacteraceae bacterium]|nr:SagB/ThcOx family dehydrogenase [Paludibacteraceae bacterium]
MNKYRMLCAAMFITVGASLFSCTGTQEPVGNTSASASVDKRQVSYILESTTKDSFDLPYPAVVGGMPLQEALAARATGREFSNKPLSDQQISDILWSANGVNRKESLMRTAPSARNFQEIDIYLFVKSGIYKYDAVRNYLFLVKAGDHRREAGNAAFFKTAPVALVYAADFERMEYDQAAKDFYSATDVGFVSQNVYLYCASNKLSTCVCGYIDRESLRLRVGALNGKVLLTQAIGYPVGAE